MTKAPGRIYMSQQLRTASERPLVSTKKYDLEERTARFGEAILKFAKKIPINPITQPLIGQLVRAATSVGSNHCEADDAGSKKEFAYRISVCKRQCRHSEYWLRMIATAVTDLRDEALLHWCEA